MKKILVVITLAFTSTLSVDAQTRVVVRRTPASKIVVVHRPIISRVMVAPVRTVIVPTIVRRHVFVVH